MWPEFVIITLAVMQLISLAALWHKGRRLQRELRGNARNEGSVPVLLLLNALSKIEQRLATLEERMPRPDSSARAFELLPTQVTPSPLKANTVANNYELAQQLAREGNDVEQLMARCRLSRNEAELVLRLYARRA